MNPAFVTTAFELPSCRIVRNLGVVRGAAMREHHGNSTVWIQQCELVREKAFQHLLQNAAQMGANGIIGMRYDATEIGQGATEFLAYGTAVIVEAAP